MITIQLADLTVTQAFGRALGAMAQPGDIITLEGDLGAGKTTLTQFIGQGLEVDPSCYITSPTFSLMHEYPGRLPMYHLDLYRLSSEEEIFELGFEDYIYGQGIAIIEWPGRLGSMMPEERLHIELLFASETSRTANLTLLGDEWLARKKEFVTLQ